MSMWQRLKVTCVRVSATLASSKMRSLAAHDHNIRPLKPPMTRSFSLTTQTIISLGLWASAIAFGVLLTLSEPALADGESPFDQTKGVVLPSKAATPILERRRAGNEWKTEEWAITPEQLGLVELKLASALGKVLLGNSLKVGNYYRQYMPARWKEFHVILVNGFYWSPSEAFPDHGIAADQWKRDLVNAFGGGCAVWYAVYVVEQDRFLDLGNDGRAIVCNAPK
jgi:hypothetical protein